MLDHFTETEQHHQLDHDQQREQTTSSSLADSPAVSPNESFLKQLFDVFDAEKVGFISVDNFVNIFKQNIADTASLHDYEHKLNQVVHSLDPGGLGRIDYDQFVNGMTKLLCDDDDANNSNSNNIIKSRRPTFSFENNENMEQTVDLLRLSYKTSQITATTTTTNKSTTRTTKRGRHFSNEEGYEEDDEEEEEEEEEEVEEEDYDPIESKSNYETSTNNNNTLEEIFENLIEDEHNPSPTNKSSSNETDDYDRLDDITNSDSDTKTPDTDTTVDPFGFDPNLMKNHRKSMTASSSSTNIFKQQFQQKFLQKKPRSAYDEHEQEQGSQHGSRQALNDELSKYENIVKKLEIQIMSLTNENESLRSEINEHISRNKSLNNDYHFLVEKLQGAEEQIFDLDRRNHYAIEEEKQKQQDLMNKMYSAHIEDQAVYLNQIATLESHLNSCRQEHSVQSKQITELYQIIQTKDTQLHREELKLKRLMDEIAELNASITCLESENAKQIDIYDKQIKQLLIAQDEIHYELNTKENLLINLQNNSLAVQNELSLRHKLEKTEAENQQLRNEIEQLNSNMEILNAQLYKNNMSEDGGVGGGGGGGLFLNFDRITSKESALKNETSLATEINTMSKEEILNKLVQEQQLTARFKDYIDDLTLKIIEHCPKIFEIKTAKRK